MRIRPEHLNRELNKSLLPVYLVTGDEPLLVQEAVDQIRSQCKVQGFDERKIMNVDRQFDWSALGEEANTLSLFAEKKLIELKLGSTKPGSPGSKALVQYLDNPPEDNILLIECNRLDAATLKSKWASHIDKAGAIVQIWPIAIEEMPRWVRQRSQTMGLKLDEDALSLLSERMEGNLLAARQELEKLKLNYPDQSISADDVVASVEDSSRYDIFNLTDACLSGNSQQVVKILSHLRTEGQEPNLCLWALSKEIRLVDALRAANDRSQPPQQVFKKYRVIQKRQSALIAASRRLTLQGTQDLLYRCKMADEQIKGIQKHASVWDTLCDIAVRFSGTRLPTTH